MWNYVWLDPSRRVRRQPKVEILGNVQFIGETLPKFRQKVSVFSKWARHRVMSGISKGSSRVLEKFGAGPFSIVRSHIDQTKRG
ncbi:LRR and NB-ARC domains-containing disease resistance protein [Prunus dulcis]|uniref:LRR and NB-ARC domains-containing disease resistance protein n=1 Tax=Prunus dulcis TaxID=3755 RepID=A0A4Y1RDQ7_PRUDU|nr:LRR and NB-ARC domains-containing disease resistance protein [Prunus dulcis]